MSDTNKKNKEKANISISGTNVNIHGDVVGGDKFVQHGFSPTDLSAQFASIQELIGEKTENKNEISQTVKNLEKEIDKGENADLNKIEKWLRFLAGMSDDIFQVTISTLTNPISGIGKAIQLIAKKAKEENLAK